GTNSGGTNSGGTNSGGTNSGGTNSGGTNSGSTNSGSTNSGGTNSSRYSQKTRPKPKRNKMPPKLMKIINECYSLNENENPNAKLALCRVVFECVLKFVVEETYKTNNKIFKDSKNLREAYFDRKGAPRAYVEFDIMKNKFTNAIKDAKNRNAFINFDLQLPHQVIHNYIVGATPVQARDTCDNLIHLIDFMLQKEEDLLLALDESLL
ncbi:pentapeptide repeat-containing protein, partial [Myroides odoratimimus]|uniref:hypothetical protein n=1 Tax=Myroides odoratimimus TaxID=76832 RepID=UPI002576E841